MVDSIHVARWIAQFDPTEVKFVLFPSGPNRRIHLKIRDLISDGRKFDNQISLFPFGGRLSLLLWGLDRFAGDRLRGQFLKSLLRKAGPDYVHALELQNAGYLTAKCLQDSRITTPFIATNYGSDIYWFSRIPKHLKRIKSLLDIADGYSAECSRDYRLAASISSGFQVMPLMPTAGGLKISALNSSKRSKIAVKGYENFWGKALVVLEALKGISDELIEYEIVFFGSDKALIEQATIAAQTTNLRLTALGSGGLGHGQVLELLSESEIYIGHSLSDGISTSMLEAMSMGAIPIQTCTSCADEWITDKKTGFIVAPNDVAAIRDAVLNIIKGEFDSTHARADTSIRPPPSHTHTHTHTEGEAEKGRGGGERERERERDPRI
jgi:glycosyltransferase involved in cell wall biosynthesis